LGGGDRQDRGDHHQDRDRRASDEDAAVTRVTSKELAELYGDGKPS
jgi:hypothetical protein